MLLWKGFSAVTWTSIHKYVNKLCPKVYSIKMTKSKLVHKFSHDFIWFGTSLDMVNASVGIKASLGILRHGQGLSWAPHSRCITWSQGCIPKECVVSRAPSQQWSVVAVWMAGFRQKTLYTVPLHRQCMSERLCGGPAAQILERREEDYSGLSSAPIQTNSQLHLALSISRNQSEIAFSFLQISHYCSQLVIESEY